MLGVRLGEHHQLHVGRVATQGREALDQVVDLVGGEREAERAIGLADRIVAAGEDVDGPKRCGLGVLEQDLGCVDVGEDALGHAVVEAGQEAFDVLRTERALERSSNR